jgi:thioredoxin 2
LSTETLKLACAACGAANRLPASRLDESPRCGKCHQPLLQAAPVGLDEAAFDRFIANTDIPVVVDFWATWCGPCHAMAPAFERVSADLKAAARFAKVDIDRSPGLASRFGIRSVPTLAVFRGGREVDRMSGALDAGSLRSWVSRHTGPQG